MVMGDGCCFKLFVALILMLLLPYFNTSLSLAVVLGHDDADADVPTMRCPEQEREALLAFKQGLVDTYNVLSSWGSKQDCCTWVRVSCSNQTGNVIHLDLSWNYLGVRFPYPIGNLTHLQYLDLSGNNFINVESLNWLSHLSSLTYLDLSSNNLSAVFGWPEVVNKLPKLTNLTLRSCHLPPPKLLSTLSNISSSKSLARVDLSDNPLSSSIFSWLSNYRTSLVDLDLSENSLTGSIFDDVGNMSSLENLDLSHNNLTGSIPDGVGKMSSLANLNLSYNQLEGADSLSFSKLCNLHSLDLSDNNLRLNFSQLVQMLLSTCADKTSLVSLILSGNHLAGSVPNLTDFSSLESLFLNRNSLSGGISESIGQMSNLVIMDFGMNSLKGVISETHFSKLSKLETLFLSSNSLVLDIHPDWVPPFQLHDLYLGSCKIGPSFPKWLQTQKFITSLDLSDAGISDILPSWFWRLFRDTTFDTRFISLSHNQIREMFHNLTLDFMSSTELHLSSNQIEGPIPPVLSQASYLDLSNNKISGPITFLCASESRNLEFLNLSSNGVSGELPDCLKHLEYLMMLDLSYNSFYGKIPEAIGFLVRMETLKLRGNRLVGELPSSLKNCSCLQLIDLGNNALSGSIPTWLGTSLENLVILLLSSNQFIGSMPYELCHLSQLRILDVSENNLSGSIPKCLNNLTALAQEGISQLTIAHDVAHAYPYKRNFFRFEYVDDAIFMWKGRMQSYRNTLGLVKRIDFSNNRLTGEIPSDITRLVGLVSLNLSRNHLTGHITPEIGKLKSLDSLDLSRNKIDGRIPTSLAQINRLAVLDLSYNNLSGKIPTGTQLQSFDSDVYAENPQLCGPPLQKKCDWEERNPEKPRYIAEDDKDELISQGFYISMVLGFVLGFWGVCGSLICIRSWRYSYYRFLNACNDWFYVRFMLIRQRWILKR